MTKENPQTFTLTPALSNWRKGIFPLTSVLSSQGRGSL